MNDVLKLAITMGDPAGVGPEIILKTLAHENPYPRCIPIVIGSKAVMQFYRDLLDIPVEIVSIRSPSAFNNARRVINVLEPEAINFEIAYSPGATNASCGKAVYHFITKAVELIQRGELDGLCTAPISKESLNLAGYDYPGHTELLATLTNTRNFAMLMVGGGLRVALATIHIALRDVPAAINPERLIQLMRLTADFIPYFGIPKPRLALAALNPHASEKGLFGTEEENIISPAISASRAENINVSGPYPADTVFHRALGGEFDVVIAMYHDQALIPIKTLDFYRGVNVTMGLPFIRTSVDHGTAFDIAGKGAANTSSLSEAIRTALLLIQNKKKGARQNA
jgi:4-hydroxythreonine-4-phosphate dehydrogenase